MYRSLYSLINYKMLERDIAELRRQYPVEFSETIENYTGVFAEAYCKDMRADFSAQITGVDDFMEQSDPNFSEWCSSLFNNDLNMFSPQTNAMNSETLYYETEELCDTLELAYNEISENYADAEAEQVDETIIRVDGNQRDLLRVNFIKLLNVLPFELFIEKQHINFRQNCFNSVMIENIHQPESYCTTTLPTRIDFTLWTDRNQIEACTNSLEEVSHLTPLSVDCVDDIDGETCDPCTKISDSLFDKYRQFVQ